MYPSRSLVCSRPVFHSDWMYLFQGVCTIFSAPNYCYRCGNQAAIMEVDETVPKQISEALYDHCNL